MANKRMFNIYVIDSDAFLDMPLSTQALYFHLNMRADDDGFIGNPKRVQRLIGASDDDLKLLIAKRFVLLFEDGVIVIKHWRMHNTIRKDRYNGTVYQDELDTLKIKENKAYSLDNGIPVKEVATTWQPLGNPDIGIGIGLDIDIDTDIEKEKKPIKQQKHKYGEYKHVLLTDDELSRLNNEFGESKIKASIKYLDEYIETSGKKYKNHNLVMRKWVIQAVEEKGLCRTEEKQSVDLKGLSAEEMLKAVYESDRAKYEKV